MVFEDLGYQFFLDKSNDPTLIFQYNPDWKKEQIIVVNKATLQLSEYTLEELQQMPPLTVVAESNRESLILIHGLILKIQSVVIPAFLLTKSKKKIAVEISSQLFEYKTDNYVFCTIRDLTGRQEIEEQLLESEYMLSSIINSIPLAVYWKDLNFNYLGANIVFAKAMGKKNTDDIVGLSDFDLSNNQIHAELFRAEDKRIIENNTAEYNIFSQYINNEGKNISVIKSKIPLRNSKGEVIGILGVFQDITEKEFMDYVFEKLQKEMFIRNRIIETFLTSQESDVYYDILQIILDFFHSNIGSFSYIENDKENILAILSRVKDKDHLEQIDVTDPNIWQQNLLTKALETKKIQINSMEPLNSSDNIKNESINELLSIDKTYAILCPIVHKSQVIALVRLTNSVIEYTPEELELLQMIAINIAPIVYAKLERDKEWKARAIAETKLKNSLHEKEVLLREVHHRVKNNLQIISSLITLQVRTINDEKIIHIFKDFQNRVRSLALVHETLYRAEDLGQINISSYIGNLIRNLYRSFQTNMDQIGYTLDIEPMNLSINQIQLSGLIINELVSNSLKYAFPDNRLGKIQIRMYSKGRLVIAEIEDDGVGIPTNSNFPSTSNIGLELVHLLSDQLKGNIEMKKEKGTKFILRFPK